MQDPVFMSGIALPLLEFCTRNATTMKITTDMAEAVKSLLSLQHTFHIIQMNHNQPKK
jgi:hypothetical protein